MVDRQHSGHPPGKAAALVILVLLLIIGLAYLSTVR